MRESKRDVFLSLILYNKTRDLILAEEILIADSFLSRLLGLMF